MSKGEKYHYQKINRKMRKIKINIIIKIEKKDNNPPMSCIIELPYTEIEMTSENEIDNRDV